MFKIKIGEERLNPHQIAILLKLRDGMERTVDLLRDMYEFGFESKSSFYTSLSELRDKGYIEIYTDGKIKLTEKGLEIINKIPLLIEPKLKSIMKYISFIMEKASEEKLKYTSIARGLEDVEELEEYKQFLEEELKIVEEKLRGWRRIRIE
ncbi:MAG: hypothetical protein QXI93_04810 [Candidatus Methanomethylicia archaeon]